MKILEACDSKILENLLPYENRCVSLLSRIHSKEVTAYFFFEESDEFLGTLAFSKYGQIFPFFTESTLEKLRKFFFDEICVFLSEKYFEFNLFSIIGEKESVDFMITVAEKVFEKVPAFENNYNLLENAELTLTSAECKKNEPTIEILCASFEMGSEIFPLQKLYEEEEVLIPGRNFDEKASKIMMNKDLARGAIHVLKFNGKIVSKLTVREKSWNFVQFGGIFTLKEFRNRKFAQILVEHVCSKYIRIGKKITLFVQKKNLPAKRLYASCGFKKIGEYKICYY